MYLEDTWYAIISSVYGGRHPLQPEGHKALIRDLLKALVIEFKLTLAAWVILDNHTHILIKSHRDAELNRFVGRWHGRSSLTSTGWMASADAKCGTTSGTLAS